jgi:hypothetical protein
MELPANQFSPRWLNENDDLLAGRTSRKRNSDSLTVKTSADTFLTARRLRVVSGELSPHTEETVNKLFPETA